MSSSALQQARWRTTGRQTLGLVLWLAVLMLGMVACGQAAADLEPEFLTSGTEIDSSLKSDNWEVTVVGYAGKDVILGDEGEDAGLAQVTQYESSAQHADRGTWVVVPVRIRNVLGEENLLFSRSLRLRDDQGNEYPLSHRNVHISFIFYTRSDEYGSDDNMIVQNVFDTDEERVGPAIFDVPVDATGLVMVLEGAEGSIATGY